MSHHYLPKDVRKIIYGISVTCCLCGKKNIQDSMGKKTQDIPFFQINTGLVFCSRRCLEDTVNIYLSEDNHTSVKMLLMEKPCSSIIKVIDPVSRNNNNDLL